MYGLKRLLEIEAERKRKREERLKKKAEKEALKKEERRKKRIKKLRHQQNQRYYAKKKKAAEEKRKKLGDVKKYCMILLVKNKRRVKRMGATWWRTDAQKIYNEILEKNREEVKFPVKIRTKSNGNTIAENKIDTKWELLIVQKNDKEDDNVAQFRNDDGKFIDVQIIDKKEYKIIAKDEWYVEEKFNVYGYHPKKDRKDYTFIVNELFLKTLNNIHDVLRVNVLSNKVIISHSEDFDFVVCKNNEEAERLYDALQKDKLLSKNKNVLFFGDIVGSTQKKLMYNKIAEKTGWDMSLCKKYSLI